MKLRLNYQQKAGLCMILKIISIKEDGNIEKYQSLMDF